MTRQIKLIVMGAIFVVGLILFTIINPFSWNDAGNRTVVERSGGEQFVQFKPGIFYAGFFAKETEWPNQISLTHQGDKPNYELVDNGIDMGVIEVMFSDRFTAKMKGITQFVLPSDEHGMILIHNTHRTPQSLVQKRLAPYAKECIQSAAQLMTADMHSSGGRAQMSQDYNQQLREGVLLLITKEAIVYDSIDKEKKRVYENIVQTDKNGQAKRKVSSIKEYGITIADAQITDYDYDSKFDERRAKLIDASTKTAASKADLIVAQQEALTAKVTGEKKLVEIEYAQKQEQTKQVVAAQTKVEVAKQDLLQQDVQLQASYKEAQKIKTLADANAYAKAKDMAADGALDKKLATYKEVQSYWASAFKEYQGNIVPLYQSGGTPGATNAMQQFMEMQNAKAMKDLNLNLNNK
jgi:hypothetical protein